MLASDLGCYRPGSLCGQLLRLRQRAARQQLVCVRVSVSVRAARSVRKLIRNTHLNRHYVNEWCRRETPAASENETKYLSRTEP